MRQFDFDILVSGGSVAGLTAAAVFGSAGFSVLCVDPAPPITEREAEGAVKPKRLAASKRASKQEESLF
jgi:2-octaprenyl-6-methoxyphenol hydroxylase